MNRLKNYELLIGCLGLWQFMLYKLQQLRIRILRITHPVSFFSRHAKFALKCRPKTSDHAVFWQIFISLEYRCLDDIGDATLIIDCGANVGYSSVYFLSRFPNAHVIAIEPDPENFAILTRNLSPYKGRYRAVHSAVWSTPTGVVLSGHRRCGEEWMRSVRAVSMGEEPTLIATDIGTLLKNSGYDRISVLKIDIEGAEAAVFSSNYERWLRKVDNLVIELHNEDCASIFRQAIARENFVVSRCEELTVCERVTK